MAATGLTFSSVQPNSFEMPPPGIRNLLETSQGLQVGSLLGGVYEGPDLTGGATCDDLGLRDSGTGHSTQLDRRSQSMQRFSQVC